MIYYHETGGNSYQNSYTVEHHTNSNVSSLLVTMVSVVRSADIKAIIILNIEFEEDIFQKGGLKERYTHPWQITRDKFLCTVQKWKN